MAGKPGISLLLADPDQNAIKKMYDELSGRVGTDGLEIVSCAREGSWRADVIMLDMASDEVAEWSKHIGEMANQKILVYFSNPDVLSAVEYGFHINPILAWQEMFPYSKRVRVYIGQLLSVAEGDDEDALLTVKDILQTAGFPVSPEYSEEIENE
ncbi:MAG TPA: hypothetical protein DCQ34_02435 [Chitinophagaceae bacterium]|nr:hypothetical protein [Chitinophagaceae bacterium]